MKLLIGDKLWSTWSLRPWLCLKRTGQPFEEVSLPLRQEDTRARILEAGSPSGKVPALIDGELVVWDSLAICEYLAEKFPDAALWPNDPVRRALGRAAASEMHSGFQALRNECPMDLSLETTAALSDATQADVRRIVALWNDLLRQFGGPYLLGAWSIADAFYTPVATRFHSYGVALADYGDHGAAQAYVQRLLREPDFLVWREDALS